MRYYLNVEIFSCEHLSVQAELNLLIRMNVNRFGLTVNEMLACLGIIKVISCGVDGQKTKETCQGRGLAVTYLHQTVIVLGAG